MVHLSPKIRNLKAKVGKKDINKMGTSVPIPGNYTESPSGSNSSIHRVGK